MAVPGGVVLLFLMGVGPSLPWGQADSQSLRSRFIIPAAIGTAVVAVCLAFGLRGVAPLAAYGFASFAAAVTLRELALPAAARMKDRAEPPWTAFIRSAVKSPRRFGGYIVHLGIIAIVVAIAASSTSVTHATATLATGKELVVGKYRLRYLGIENGEEPHRKWTAAKLELTEPSGNVEVLTPRMNFYERSNDPVGTPAVKSHLTEDFYVSLLAFSDEGRAASFNAWIFPLVGWIWWMIPILVLGSLISLWPNRRRALAASLIARSSPAITSSPSSAA
jgi:cytochrome c-type biogenesis protein CcmF